MRFQFLVEQKSDAESDKDRQRDLKADAAVIGQFSQVPSGFSFHGIQHIIEPATQRPASRQIQDRLTHALGQVNLKITSTSNQS